MWLRSAWLDHASEGLLLLAAIGALAQPRRAAPLWVALAAHHAVLLALGVLDRTLYYRFFVADLVLAVPLACLGLHALRSLLVLPWRRLEPVVAAGIAAVALAGYLGNLREIGTMRERLARRQHTPAAAACIEAQLARHEAPVIVVPSVLFGNLLFRLREAPVGMLLVPPALPVTPLDPKRAVLALAFESDGPPPTGEPTLCRRDGVLLRRLRSGA